MKKTVLSIVLELNPHVPSKTSFSEISEVLMLEVVMKVASSPSKDQFGQRNRTTHFVLRTLVTTGKNHRRLPPEANKAGRVGAAVGGWRLASTGQACHRQEW